MEVDTIRKGPRNFTKVNTNRPDAAYRFTLEKWRNKAHLCDSNVQAPER
jgi:hypothetical protein